MPAVLHVNHRARMACLPIYKHRFQIQSRQHDLWETYLLADHDLLALSSADFPRPCRPVRAAPLRRARPPPPPLLREAGPARAVHSRRMRPALAVASTPVDMGRWLKTCLIAERRGEDQRALDIALGTGEEGAHAAALCHFAEPRYGIAWWSMNAEGRRQVEMDDTGAFRAFFCDDGMFQMVSVDGHHAGRKAPCPWAR